MLFCLFEWLKVCLFVCVFVYSFAFENDFIEYLFAFWFICLFAIFSYSFFLFAGLIVLFSVGFSG